MATTPTTEAAPARRKRVAKSPQDRRADILRAGAEVFAATGFTDARISDITTAAQIAKGTFYLHFETKDHLLGALWEEYVDTFVATTERILEETDADTTGAWWPAVDRLLTALIRHAADHAALHRIVYGSANARALELCKASNARVIDLMSAFVTRGAHAGAFTCQDPDWTFRMIYHAADGLLDDLINRPSPLDTPRITRSVLELAHRALGNPTPAADRS
ncbi:TetR/AcrR family transcriptional regulator [Streptomyces sp. HU2014]|uniref:Transcriptional regulator n=1 Tax=Streptomyces albireticuli TaxID=1940 RepID=A0A1Z2KUR8_9ACTN|nr:MULTISPECIES: TetR/AcrR family transcriptional regulator [Streptomyces]ARZ65794.1 transcriptional regulator [Streptomyces albireticuli]UQI45964.1 TetR/AcrR family transcriptional regulator [Streptomyces sp. HU2014]UQI46084.1 TetR/AcrR family transcriptional regulator [Streptomyces sp. HU2014]